MFSIVAFSESQDLAGAWGNIAAVPDQHVRTEGDYLYCPQFNRLVGAMACLGATADQCRIISPSMRHVNPHYITPLDAGIYPDGNLIHAVNPNMAYPLVPTEGIEVEEINDPAAAEQHTVILWLSDQEIVPVKGPIITVHFTITVTLVAGEWVFCVMNIVDELPIAAWTIVGAKFIADEAVAARFVSPGVLNRPGVPCEAGESKTGGEVFRFGNLGEFLTFQTNNPPGIEIIGSAAEAEDTYDCYMDLIAS
jgi:hypothetical protein